MAVIYRYTEIVTAGILFFRSRGVSQSQDSFSSAFRLRLWETSSGVVATEARRDMRLRRKKTPTVRITIYLQTVAWVAKGFLCAELLARRLFLGRVNNAGHWRP